MGGSLPFHLELPDSQGAWVLSGKGRMRPLQEGVAGAKGVGLRRGVAGSSVGHLSRVFGAGSLPVLVPPAPRPKRAAAGRRPPSGPGRGRGRGGPRRAAQPARPEAHTHLARVPLGLIGPVPPRPGPRPPRPAPETLPANESARGRGPTRSDVPQQQSGAGGGGAGRGGERAGPGAAGLGRPGAVGRARSAGSWDARGRGWSLGPPPRL